MRFQSIYSQHIRNTTWVCLCPPGLHGVFGFVSNSCGFERMLSTKKYPIILQILCFEVHFWAFRMAIRQSIVLSCDPSKGQLGSKFSKNRDVRCVQLH